MPCYTGRAGHTLLKKDCQPGCACCVNTTYSCGLLKCDEQIDNNKSNAILAAQELIDNVDDSEGSGPGVVAVAIASLEIGDSLQGLGLLRLSIQRHCPFSITYYSTNEDCNILSMTVENTVITEKVEGCELSNTINDTIQFRINGVTYVEFPSVVLGT